MRRMIVLVGLAVSVGLGVFFLGEEDCIPPDSFVDSIDPDDVWNFCD